MSRTREEVIIESPVKATIFYNGKKGSFGRMSDNDGEGIVEVPLPIHFVVLDNSTHRVTGKKGLDKDAPRYRSTLGHDARSKKLRVWMNGAQEITVAEGTWGAISEKLPGAKFTRCIYAITDFGTGKQMVCIQLHGRALFAWMDYLKKNNLNPCSDIAFSIRSTAMMAGNIGGPSLVPIFSHATIQAETVKAAAEADKVLQDWLDTIFAGGGLDGAAAVPEDGETQPGNYTQQVQASRNSDPFPTESDAPPQKAKASSEGWEAEHTEPLPF